MKYKYNKNFKIKKEKENYIIYDDEKKLIYDINEFGYEIVNMLSQNISVEKIIECQKNKYEVKYEIIKKEIIEFITDMHLLKIIELIDYEFPSIDKLTYVDSIDIDSYLNLRELVGWEKISKKQAKKSLDNSYCTIACKHNSAIIGMARVMWDGGYTAFIVDVIVNPIWQRKKIGTVMMQKLEQKLYDSLENGDKLMINLYSSKDKHSFYSKLGFSQGIGFIKWICK